MTDKMICGFCMHYDDDEVWCPYKGEVYPEDTCDNWTNEAEQLTEEEMKAIKGDYDAHIEMVEGEIEV